MKFILSFYHKSNHLIEYFSLWCHLYLYLILIVMSFVPNINIRYIWHHHDIKSSFSLQNSFKTYQLSFWMIQIQLLTCDLGIGMQIIDKKCVWSLVKKVEMTSVNGFKNIILNENTEGILVFIEVNFCWYIVVSIAIKHFQ